MNENCSSNNPLVRDGTSQPQRLLQALLPSYVAVDERSMKDLLQFAKEYGKEIQFYDLDSADAATWEGFYKLTENWETFSVEEFLIELKKYQQTKPHLALFLAFLYQLKVVQADLNTITQRHLDFYYREVLQMKERSAVADQVAVVFQLAKHVHQYRIKGGTALKAGKDAAGMERIYKVEEDVVINRAQVVEIRAVYANLHDTLPDAKNRLGLVNHRLYASPVANSSDGQGGGLETEEKSWATFGRPTISGPLGLSDRPAAAVGFALASPLLFLAEGDRKISIVLECLTAMTSVPSIKESDFSIRFSGAEEWIAPLGTTVSLSSTELPAAEGAVSPFSFTLTLTTFLTPDQVAVVAYRREALGEAFDTSWPMVKVTLNSDSAREPFLYHDFKSLQIRKTTIAVEVNGVRNLILQNDQGVLDSSKPFLPFGARPYIGSNFHIGSWEVFQKRLDTLKLHYSWNNLPETGIDSHYQHPNEYQRAKADFKCQPAVLIKRNWTEIGGDKALFSADETITNNVIAIGGTEEPLLRNFQRDETQEAVKKYGVDTQSGFLRLSLRNQDFGHSSFSKIYAENAIALATWQPPCPGAPPETKAKKEQSKPILPNAPYTPLMQDLYLSYSSSISYPLSEDSTDRSVEQFFHLHPFGASKIDLTKASNYLLPPTTDEGQLFIGIKDLSPPQTLSLLFAIAEGSANPIHGRQQINWSYLAGDQWINFGEKELLHDSTDGLLNTGIIRFAIPQSATLAHTRMPSGLHWIRAAVVEKSDAVCRLIDIKTQAVFARFQDQGNDPEHLRQPLIAGSIKKLLISESGIEKVIQPYASFGGKVKEARPDFYTRTSERLRHKNRAITIWDYERLILNQFPSVYKVKCVNHTRFTGTLEDYSEQAPGHVTLIIISNVVNKNAIDPLRPKTSLSLLNEIEEYVKSLSPPCITFHVRNPIYEEVSVDFKVKFHKGRDTGYYQQQLENEIRHFLSPWAAACLGDIRFGGRLHKSVVLNFVEERSYVDYLSCFKMYHTTTNGIKSGDVEEAVAKNAVSILGSANTHTIDAIEEDGCECSDNVTKASIASIDSDCGCQKMKKS